MTTIYLWVRNAKTDYQPRRMAEVRVDGSAVEVLEAHHPEIVPFFEELGRRERLSLTEESVTPGGIAMRRVEITPEDPRYAFALGEAAGREGFLVTYSSEAP